MSGPTLNTEKVYKSILNLRWNGMCPTETVHLDDVFQRSACQSLFALAFRRTQGKPCNPGEVARAASTDSFAVVFIGLTKPLAFPGSLVPSLCLGFFPNLSFSDVSSSFGFTNSFFCFWLSFLPEWGDGQIVKTIVGGSELCVRLSTVSVFSFGEMA